MWLSTRNTWLSRLLCLHVCREKPLKLATASKLSIINCASEDTYTNRPDKHCSALSERAKYMLILIVFFQVVIRMDRQDISANFIH